jgi:hypothetical protein
MRSTSKDDAPYPSPLRRLVEASLLALPHYAALALYAPGLRVVQYGLDRGPVLGGIVAVAVAGYAVGLRWRCCAGRGRWLQTLEPVNRWMCWAVLALALLGNSPLLDPVRRPCPASWRACVRTRPRSPAVTSTCCASILATAVCGAARAAA